MSRVKSAIVGQPPTFVYFDSPYKANTAAVLQAKHQLQFKILSDDYQSWITKAKKGKQFLKALHNSDLDIINQITISMAQKLHISDYCIYTVEYPAVASQPYNNPINVMEFVHGRNNITRSDILKIYPSKGPIIDYLIQSGRIVVSDDGHYHTNIPMLPHKITLRDCIGNCFSTRVPLERGYVCEQCDRKWCIDAKPNDNGMCFNPPMSSVEETKICTKQGV